MGDHTAPVALVRLEKGKGPASFRLIGELDYSNVPEVAARLQDELRQAGDLTLDTSELSFMDSQGLHMLIQLGAEAIEGDTTVRVLNCSRQVRRLLDVAISSGIPGVKIIESEK
jgi:anti-sigma B factor antagonist